MIVAITWMYSRRVIFIRATDAADVTTAVLALIAMASVTAWEPDTYMVVERIAR